MDGAGDDQRTDPRLLAADDQRDQHPHRDNDPDGDPPDSQDSSLERGDPNMPAGDNPCWREIELVAHLSSPCLNASQHAWVVFFALIL